ncbi:tetratricopeptide repeat protein [Nonomuraea angiospora]|uniref:tetratricopeptide repeat protein n=1 Tax=Nonomuraea angiospora TaxID=46172 RepID=UPI0029AD3550|nr:hypothetical protein [Nonomuraea angiospora]MDX3099840.1 hypothetical protein [Nonomuraea angiospora]
MRALVAKAAQQGGLVVLVGGSSVGKTRCAVEALRATVPQWWLWQPSDAEQVRQIAEAPPTKLVVWLDELHRFLGGSTSLHASTVRALLHAGAVLIATLWPDRYTTYTTPPQAGQPDLYVHEGEVLRLADVIQVPSSVSEAERALATAMAASDDRIAIALESTDYGLFQVIAAAPQLVERWHAADPYAAAVITAAIDAVRLGVESPLCEKFLEEAAPGYCDARQRSEAPENWFELAVTYLTTKVRGAASMLAPSAPPGAMGRRTGFLVADYLQQYLGKRRRMAKVPASTWRALKNHLRNPNDQSRVGLAARDRLLYCYAEPLLMQAQLGGIRHAAFELYDLLIDQGRTEEGIAVLTPWANKGDNRAVSRIVDFFADQGKLGAALSIVPKNGDWTSDRLAHALAAELDLDRLRARANAGDKYAAARLAEVLARQKKTEELRSRSNAGEMHASAQLAVLLASQSRVAEGISIVKPWADAGELYASSRLNTILAKHGMVNELRSRANMGDIHAAGQLASLLAKEGNADELRTRAAAGDGPAAFQLANLLVGQQGWIEKASAILQECSGVDEWDASEHIAELLAENGCVEELSLLAGGGNWHASLALADIFAENGREDEAIAVLKPWVDAGEWIAADSMSRLLVAHGRSDEAISLLESWASEGSREASYRLADLLAEEGRLEKLRDRVDAGDWSAAQVFAEALATRGFGAEADNVRRYGLSCDSDGQHG